MILKFLFDRITALVGLLVLWPVLLIVAILIKMKMSGGPAFFIQKRVGKGGRLFNCHKFRTMKVNNNNHNANDNQTEANEKSGWSTVSVAGDSRITPLGAKLRHYKLDELPGLWDVLIGNMSFVGPRPDVPGYADKLVGDDRDVLKLRPGITGPATLKYRLEDEYLANARNLVYSLQFTVYGISKEELDKMSDQEVVVWYNDNVIYPDKVRLNCYYYRHYSFIKDIQMILCTVLGKKMNYAGEVI
jgi:lipopolysaccharide/colanic/teichoic acid biosynthesis glycosyltransferase